MMRVCDVQLKAVLEQRKAELTASYEQLLAHIAAMRKQVCLLLLCLQASTPAFSVIVIVVVVVII